MLYRVYSLTPSNQADAKQLGVFSTTEFAESRINIKMRLVLNPQWKIALYIEKKIIVPKNVILNIGIIIPVKLLSGTILGGCAEQVFLSRFSYDVRICIFLFFLFLGKNRFHHTVIRFFYRILIIRNY